MNGKPKIDWEAIEREYRAGQLSIREVARKHGVSDTAIRKEAKAKGWKRDLADKVRKAVREEVFRRMPSPLERCAHEALKEAFGGRERGVVLELLFLIDQGVLAEQYGWPEIASVTVECQLPHGRADIVLGHADGSATVIECKASRSARDILPAVGQVMAYGIQVSSAYSFNNVRLAIASRVSGADLGCSGRVMKACGIQPVFCGQHDTWARMFAEEFGSGLCH